MSNIDKAKVQHYLVDRGAWEGKRCKSARNSDNGDIIACAIACSALNDLASLAKSKRVVTAADIETYVRSFEKAAGMELTEQPMGGLVYVRDNPHPLPKGTRIRSIKGESDSYIDREGMDQERHTGLNAIGVVDDANYYGDSNGWNYGVWFEPSGVYVTIDQVELADDKLYEILEG